MIGDARHLPLKDESIDCVITSPPYWSLRKYDIPDSVWDGDKGCEHEWVEHIRPAAEGTKTLDGNSALRAGHQGTISATMKPTVSSFCSRCNAWRGQLGLEPTIDLYLKHLLQCFDEVKRVLKKEGTLWVNLGDSYSNSGGSGSGEYQKKHTQFGKIIDQGTAQNPHRAIGFTPKTLCLIPERFAISMVEREWILRNKIIWYKPNCMPASVKDRFTVDFEPVFFFVKNRRYWFEQQYEPLQKSSLERGYSYKNREEYVSPKKKNNPGLSCPEMGRKYIPQGRNSRCVWTIPTQPYPESHFATFPEALVEPMIKSGCPKESGGKCGKAREKILIPTEDYKKLLGKGWTNHEADLEQGLTVTKNKKVSCTAQYDFKGLTDCGCNAGSKPGIVLDPFCGSGTVIKVAERLQRIGIGFDLGYEKLEQKRTEWNQVELIV